MRRDYAGQGFGFTCKRNRNPTFFNSPLVRVDFRKVVDGKSETKTISLNVEDLYKLAKNIKFDKFMTEMGWED